MKASKSNKNLQSLISEQLRKTNNFVISEKSELISTYEHRGQTNPHLIFYFDNQSTKCSKDPAVFLEMAINPQELIHNCECHKLAAISFFEWTSDGKYKQVPLIEGMPNLHYVVLGVVEEINVQD